MYVMSSNVIQEGVTSLAEAAGASDNSPLMLAINILVMVAVTIVASKAAGPRLGTEEAEEGGLVASAKAAAANRRRGACKNCGCGHRSV